MPFNLLRNWNRHAAQKTDWLLNHCLCHIVESLAPSVGQFFALNSHLAFLLQGAISSLVIFQLLVAFNLHLQCVENKHLI